MMIVNEFGRQWDELDALRARAAAREVVGDRAFSVCTTDGVALLGRVTEESPTRLIIQNWKVLKA